MDDYRFYLEKAEWWREYAKLGGSEHERQSRVRLAEYFDKLAEQHKPRPGQDPKSDGPER